MLHPLEALHHFFDPNTRAAGFRPDGATNTAGTPLFFNPIYWHSVCVQVITPLPPSLFLSLSLSVSSTEICIDYTYLTLFKQHL